MGSTNYNLPSSSIPYQVPIYPTPTHICFHLLLPVQFVSSTDPTYPSTGNPEMNLTGSSSLILWPNHCRQCALIMSHVSTTSILALTYPFLSSSLQETHYYPSCTRACSFLLPTSALSDLFTGYPLWPQDCPLNVFPSASFLLLGYLTSVY